MKLQAKSFFSKFTLFFCAVNFLFFILFYLCNFIFSSSFSAFIATYIIPFISDFVNVLIPILSAMAMLIASYSLSLKGILIRSLPFAFAKILYTLPYYYLHFIFDGYDSVESILHSLLWSIPNVAFVYILNIAFFFLMRAVIVRHSAEGDESFIKEKSFRISNSLNFSFLICSIAAFIYLTVREIIDTVSYFISYFGSFVFSEILLIMVSYLVNLLILFVLYY